MGLIAPIVVRLVVAVSVTVGVLLIAQMVPASRHGRGALALALGLGYAFGQLLFRGLALPPVEAVDRVFYLAAAVAVAGAIGESWVATAGPCWCWLGRFCVTAVALWFLLGPLVGGSWTQQESAVRLGMLGVVWLLAWGNASALAERLGPDLGLPLVMVAIGVVVVNGLSGSIVLATLGIAAVAVLATGWVVGGTGPTISWDNAAVGVVVMVLGGLLTVGLFYGEVPPLSALLLAVAPAGAWADRLIPAGRRSSSAMLWKVCRCAAVLTLLAVAVGAAVWASPGDFHGLY